MYITDFKYKHSIKDAIFFYFIWLGIIMLATFVLRQGFPNPTHERDLIARIVSILPVIIATSILQAKQFTWHLKYVLIGLVIGLISVYISTILAFIPVAYLTTLSPQKITKKKH